MEILDLIFEGLSSIHLMIWAVGSIFVLAMRKSLEEMFISGINIFKGLIMKWFRRHMLGKNEFMRNVAVNEILTEIRITNQCSRAHVNLFSNGEIFSINIPQFKVSQVFESLAPGTSSTILQSQNLRVSIVLQLIAPLFDINNRCKLDYSYCTCGKDKTCKFPYGVYNITVSELEEGYLKSKCIEHGIHYIVLAPIIDSHQNIAGFVSLDYNHTSYDEMLKVLNPTEICQAAQSISFHLKQKN